MSIGRGFPVRAEAAAVLVAVPSISPVGSLFLGVEGEGADSGVGPMFFAPVVAEVVSVEQGAMRRAEPAAMVDPELQAQ